MSSSGGLLHYTNAAATLDLILHFASFTENWFKSITISLASLWLIWRVYLVTVKPVDELVGLLGLEVPAQPEASLAGIKADGVTLHWKPRDGTVTRWLVAINGINVGEVGPKENTVTVYGLKPDSSYTARLIALNAHFQTASEAIRFSTLPAASDDYYREHKDDADTEGGEGIFRPILKPAKALFDVAQLPSPQPMAREHSGSLSHRRNTHVRRVSPILTDDVVQPGDDSSEAVRELTNRLEILRRDNDETERQEREEQEDFESTRKALEEERDRYRKQLKEKDDTSRDLKKEVTRLERANTSVQGSKNNAERKLQHKHNDRKKMKDDITRWDHEVEEMRAAVEKLLEQKDALEKETESKLDSYRDQLAKEQEANKALEEDIKDKSMQIKGLEQDQRKSSDGDFDPILQTTDALDEEERAFEGRLRSLQMRYTNSWNDMVASEATYQSCQQHLIRLQQRRLSTPQAFASTPTLEAAPTRRTSNRRGRAGSLLNDTQVASSTTFGAIGAPPANSHSVSPTYSNIGSPFFNMTNGMTLGPEERRRPASFTQEQINEITAGAPMSPSTAGALLPSNLFTDDVASTAASNLESEARRNHDVSKPAYLNYRHILNDDAASLDHRSNRNSTALPGLGAIPGLGAASSAEPTEKRVPSSPTSADSRSPSIYMSPRASTNHLPHKDSFNEVDRRSIRSNTNSSRGQSSTSRFFGGLSSLRHRAGKASQDEGPALGSLKSSQTQSMPRQDPPEQDGIDPKRRGSHSGGGWMGMPSISQAFSRNTKDAEVTSVHSNELPRSSRLRPFGVFGRSGGGDPWLASSLLNRSIPPRPPSAHSSDNANVLPRPDTGSETRFGWPVEGSISDRQRISPLGADWAVPGATSWSRHPSRRPSAQYGPSALNADTMIYDSDMSPSVRRSPTQAPIGTRPQTSHGQGTGGGIGEGTSAPPTPNPPSIKPSLNPAAPSFSLSFLSRSKKPDDGEQSDIHKSDKKKDKKGKGKDKDQDSAPPSATDTHASTLETPRVEIKESTSPPESRKSKDTRSISTADGSFLDSSVASMPRDSLEQTRSRTPSESQQSQLTPLSSRDPNSKESFMQKLSRKTSQTSSKLSRPFSFTGRKSTSTASPALEGRESTPTPDETDEDLGRSIESIHFAPSSVTGSPVVRPSTDGEDGLAEGRRDKGRGKWGSLKLTRKEKKKGEPEAESITASETDTADEEADGLNA